MAYEFGWDTWNLSFCICKMGMLMIPLTQCYCEDYMVYSMYGLRIKSGT